ncbi:hypothetical protein BDW59DRAFT_154054 [Aspergillus cavernicola]|uniref:Uncharacterized protein n=1 Tax=Aspergillus cavernicola TaxID=176166 RepID=A0ABR4HIQ8_9EURO
MTFGYPSLYVRRLVAKSSTSTNPVLRRLKEFSARWWDTEQGLPSSYILPFFRLLSLRMFNGVMISDGEPDRDRQLREDQDHDENEDYAEEDFDDEYPA